MIEVETKSATISERGYDNKPEDFAINDNDEYLEESDDEEDLEDGDLLDGEDLAMNKLEWEKEEEEEEEKAELPNTADPEEIRFSNRIRTFLSNLKVKAEAQIADPESHTCMNVGIARLLHYNSVEVLVDRAVKGTRQQDRRSLGKEKIDYKDLLKLSAEETGRFGVYVNVVLDSSLRDGYELYVGSATATGGLSGMKAGLSGRWSEHRKIIQKGIKKLQDLQRANGRKELTSRHYTIAAAPGAKSNFRILASWPRLYTVKSAKLFRSFALLMEGIYMLILDTFNSNTPMEVISVDRLLPGWRTESKEDSRHDGLNRSFPICAGTLNQHRHQKEARAALEEFFVPKITANGGICLPSYVQEAWTMLRGKGIALAPSTIRRWWTKYVNENHVEREYSWTDEEEEALIRVRTEVLTWEETLEKMASLGYHRSMSAYKHRWGLSLESEAKKAVDISALERRRVATLAIIEVLYYEHPQATHTLVMRKAVSELMEYDFQMNTEQVRNLMRKESRRALQAQAPTDTKSCKPSNQKLSMPWTTEEMTILRTIFIEEGMCKNNWSAKTVREILESKGISRTLHAVKQRVLKGLDTSEMKMRWAENEDIFLLDSVIECEIENERMGRKRKGLTREDWGRIHSAHDENSDFPTRTLRAFRRRATELRREVEE